MFSFPRRYLQQQRRTRGHRRRVQRNERFSLPLPLPLLRYLRFSKLAKVDRLVRRCPYTRADIPIGDPRTHTDECRSPLPSVIEPLYRPAFMDTHCLDVELPLQSRVGIQVINAIRLGPVTQIPLGVRGRRGRSTSAATAGSGTVTLACAREGIALGRLGDTEYRRRYGRQNALAGYDGLLTIAAKDLVGTGPNWMWQKRRGGGRAGIEEHILGCPAASEAKEKSVRRVKRSGSSGIRRFMHSCFTTL